MATSLQRAGLRLSQLHRSAILSTKSFSSQADALVEVRPGEIGAVSGIPEEHLRRRVCVFLIILPFLFRQFSRICASFFTCVVS